MPTLAWLAWLLWTAAWAHPFGSTLYGHLLQVTVDRDRVQVEYLAEVPTPDLLRDLRHYLEGVEAPGPAEQAAFTEKWLDELEGGLKLYVDDQPVPWTRLPPREQSGVGDTRFIRFVLSLEAPLSEGARTLNLVNGNMPDEVALFSTELLVSDAIVVDDCSLFRVQDGQLKDDRSGKWRMEEASRELRLAFHQRSALGEAVSRNLRRIGGSQDVRPAREALATVARDPLQDLVTGELTPMVVVMGLGLAVVLGAAHALSPGHGKALVAAYLLGSRQTVRHAVWLGLIVTVTHTAGVYALGAVAWLLEETAPPEVILPWLEVASGLLVLGVGMGLLRSRWRSAHAAHHDHAHHDHAHHDHDHEHDHDALGEEAHARAHAAEYAADSFRDLVLLGVSGGLAPCPSALVLLLTALSFHRLGFGLVLVFAFSLGLALLVTAIGVAVVLLGDRVRAWRFGSGRVLRLLPVASAVVVVVLGLAITWRGIGAVQGLLPGTG